MPPGIGRHIVGKQGRKINEIQAKNKVDIRTGQPNKFDETKLTINGKPNNVREAIEDITKIINEHLEKKRQQKKDRAGENKLQVLCNKWPV